MRCSDFLLNNHTVEPRLFEPKTPLPGNEILPAETKAPKRLRKTKQTVADKTRATNPPIRGYSSRTRKSRLEQECVVVPGDSNLQPSGYERGAVSESLAFMGLFARLDTLLFTFVHAVFWSIVGQRWFRPSRATTPVYR